jgi:hypothetical protein
MKFLFLLLTVNLFIICTEKRTFYCTGNLIKTGGVLQLKTVTATDNSNRAKKTLAAAELSAVLFRL